MMKKRACSRWWPVVVAFLMVAASLPAMAQICPPSGNPLVAPDSRYDLSQPGAVTDTVTGLTWKRCPEGRSGADCAIGTTAKMTWSAALSAAEAANAGNHAGFDDWRLPNIIELETLVETGCYGPAINTMVFPQNSWDWYWSSTTFATDTSYAWYMQFTGGLMHRSSKNGDVAVRLVRGGEWVGPVNADPGLDALSLTGHVMSPDFDTSVLAYSASVTESVDQIEVVAQAAEATSSVNIAGQGAEFSASTRTVGLVHGSNAIDTQVTADDGVTTRTYTITVFRNAAIALDAVTLAQIYDGTARVVTATTTPAGYAYEVEYKGINGTVYPLSLTPPINVGNYEVTATLAQPGGFSGSAVGELIVGLADQTISFGINPGPLAFGGASGSVSAVASSGLPVIYSTASSACSVDAATGAITMLAAGNCVITANQPGDGNFSAAPPEDQTVVINKGAGTVTFSSLGFDYDGNTHAVTAFITEEAATACVVPESPVGPDVGSYPVTATCTGTNYDGAGNATASVGLADQTISFGVNPGPLAFGGASGSVSAVASSGLPVIYSTASSACSVDAATGAITMLAAGNCVITANQAGNGNYNAAPPVDQTVVITPATQMITNFITTPPTPMFAPGGSFTVSAQGGASGEPVTFDSITLAVCTVNGNVVSMLQPGTCNLVANQAGNDRYAPAPQVMLAVLLGRALAPVSVPMNSPSWLFALGLLLIIVGVRTVRSER